MENITFEQLPQAVSLLIEKVGQLADKLDAALDKSQHQDENHRILGLEDVSAMLGKSTSTIYAMTSDKRIPYHKRGNKLYFFEDEIIRWIKDGGTSGMGSEEDFNERLTILQNEKRHKPRTLQARER